MKVFVAGMRGLPGVQGGIETHAEELYPLLAQEGWQVTLAVRPRYYPNGVPATWKDIRLLPVWSPALSGVEAFTHNLLAVAHAALQRPDLVHLHAVGAGYAVVLARALGLRVVFTHHGPDYEREKWGPFARLVLRVGEFLAVRCANGVICVSRANAAEIERRLGCHATVIANGVRPRAADTDPAILCQFGLTAGRYILQVGRLVREKRQLDLIEAFAHAALDGWRLVIVGELDGGRYANEVVARAAAVPGVVLTGFQSGLTLHSLYAGAGMFVLPSSLEGLSIALLEALSYGLPVIASDIDANLQIELDAQHYFALGDVASLRARMETFAAVPHDPQRAAQTMQWVGERFGWNTAVRATDRVYRAAVTRK